MNLRGSNGCRKKVRETAVGRIKAGEREKEGEEEIDFHPTCGPLHLLSRA